MKAPSPRVLGAALLGAFALHAASKDAAHLQEMFWLCHVATALMGIGLLAGWHRVVASGFLFHVGFGTVGWVLDMAMVGTTPSSVLIHLLSLVAGGVEVRRKGWPRGLVLPAWAFFTLWVISCHWTTDPALNVNLVHAVWEPLTGLVTHVWLSAWLNSGAMLVGFILTDAAMRRLGRPALSASP